MKMINTKLSIALMAAVLLTVSQSRAAITINSYLEGLQGTGGTAPYGTAVWFADTDANGILTTDLQLTLPTVSSQWSLDADDLVLGVFGFQADGSLDAPINYDQLVLGIAAGTDLYVAWYPDLQYTGPSMAGPGQNQAFGVYRDTLGALDGDIGFDSPNDGTYNLLRLTGDPGYSGANLSGFQTIPEPSSAMLVLCGLGLARMIRRRRNS